MCFLAELWWRVHFLLVTWLSDEDHLFVFDLINVLQCSGVKKGWLHRRSHHTHPRIFTWVCDYFKYLSHTQVTVWQLSVRICCSFFFVWLCYCSLSIWCDLCYWLLISSLFDLWNIMKWIKVSKQTRIKLRGQRGDCLCKVIDCFSHLSIQLGNYLPIGSLTDPPEVMWHFFFRSRSLWPGRGSFTTPASTRGRDPMLLCWLEATLWVIISSLHVSAAHIIVIGQRVKG